LLLGNIEHEFWGWADPQSVFLLDYWKSLDPQIAFILVYDKPQDLIARAFEGSAPLTPDALEAATGNWRAYNEALLSFYHRNPERCLLVHAQQIRANSNDYLQQVRTRIGAPVSTEALLSASAADADDTTGSAAEEAGYPTEIAERALSKTGHAQGKTSPDHALRAYIAQAILQQYPATLQLYEELQSVANLPLDDQIASPISAYDAWSAMAAVMAQHARKTQQAQVQAQAQTAQIENLANKLMEAEALAIEEQQENELLLLNLHRAQEELEQQFLNAEEIAAQSGEQLKLAQDRAAQIEKLQQRQAELNQALTEATQWVERLRNDKAELQKQRNELAAKAEALAHYPELEQENELLLLQLHQVQEELEQQYLNAQEQAAQTSEQLKQVRAKKQQVTQQAQAIEQDRDAQSKLAEERAAQIQKLQQSQTQLNAALTEAKQLAEQLNKEKADLQKERDDLAAKAEALAHPPEPLLYGAADRIKRQLSYRLGATMIEHSRTLGGWLGMPFALFREARQFHREAPQRAATPLPPIDQYADAHEAEQIKQHLSYRLGAAMIEKSRTPLGWIKLPWALRSAVLDFKRSRGMQ